MPPTRRVLDFNVINKSRETFRAAPLNKKTIALRAGAALRCDKKAEQSANAAARFVGKREGRRTRESWILCSMKEKKGQFDGSASPASKTWA